MACASVRRLPRLSVWRANEAVAHLGHYISRSKKEAIIDFDQRQPDPNESELSNDFIILYYTYQFSFTRIAVFFVFFRTLWLAPISCFTFFDLDHPGAGLLVWSRSCTLPIFWIAFIFLGWFDSFGRSRLTGLRFSQRTELQVVACLAARLQHEIALSLHWLRSQASTEGACWSWPD